MGYSNGMMGGGLVVGVGLFVGVSLGGGGWCPPKHYQQPVKPQCAQSQVWSDSEGRCCDTHESYSYNKRHDW